MPSFRKNCNIETIIHTDRGGNELFKVTGLHKVSVKDHYELLATFKRKYCVVIHDNQILRIVSPAIQIGWVNERLKNIFKK